MRQTEFQVDRKKTVGLFLPTYNSIKLAQSVYTSLIRSMPDGYPFGIVVLDGGSTDGTVEYFKGQVALYEANSIAGYETKGLCKDTPNAAIEVLLGKWLKNEKRFEHEDRYGYIGWLHTDMNFVQQGWLGKLVEKYESIKDCGIIGSRTDQYDDPVFNSGDWLGNVAPFIVSVENMKKCYERYGWFIDPRLWFCVSHCDWDMHRRFMGEMGLKSVVTSVSVVRHTMLGTRVDLHKAEPQRDSCVHQNEQLYQNKWKTSKDPFSEEAVTRKRFLQQQDYR